MFGGAGGATSCKGCVTAERSGGGLVDQAWGRANRGLGCFGPAIDCWLRGNGQREIGLS